MSLDRRQTSITSSFTSPLRYASQVSGTYLATLANGDVITITRQQTPYATTFSDGRVTTISALSSTPDVVVGTTSGGRTIYRTLETTVYVGSATAGARNSTTDDQADLSPGGIAGVVVGVVLAAILLVGFGVFLLQRRRRRITGAGSHVGMQDESRSKVINRHEKDGLGVSELHEDALMFGARDGARYELEQPRPELEGSRP